MSDQKNASGGGSQDSIDEENPILSILDNLAFANDETMTFDKVYKSREAILAWHNTQLKASIPEKWKTNASTNTQGKNYAAGYNQAIDDTLKNIEKL